MSADYRRFLRTCPKCHTTRRVLTRPEMSVVDEECVWREVEDFDPGCQRCEKENTNE